MNNIQHFKDLRQFYLKRNLHNIWGFQKDFEIGLAYSRGLIISNPKPTFKSISIETGIKVIAFSDLLSQELNYWEITQLFEKEIELLNDDGELALDEVIIPKENTTKMDAHIVHCSSQKRRLLGQEYLVLIWIKDNKTVVINVVMAHKGDERLKISINMIENFLKSGKKIKGLRADGWFFKENFVKNLRELKLGLISRPRKDGDWWLGNKEVKLKNYAPTIGKDSFHYYSNEKLYAKAIIVSNQKYHTCKVVIVKPKYGSKPEDYIFIVSTNPNLTVREIIAGKKARWKIEVVFRDCSQNLGLKSCQARKGASKAHVAMVFLTYNYLSSIKEKEGGTIGKIKRKIIKSCEPLPTKVLGYNENRKVA